MALVQATIRDNVRRIVGNPKKTEPEELLDVSIENELNAALRTLDKYVPNWRLYSLTTTDEGQKYTPADGVAQVLAVYWFGTTDIASIFGEEFDVFFGVPLYDPETGYYNWCVDWLARQQAYARYDWEFNSGENKIYLIPESANADATVYYVGAVPWTWDAVPAGREDVVTKYAVAQCLKILGRSRSKLSGVQRAGGLINYGAVDGLTKDGKDEEQQVRDLLQAESQRWMFLI